LQRISFEHIDENGNHSTKNPKNFESIFWKWYGIAALSPGYVKAMKPFLIVSGMTVEYRMPVIDTTSYLEDVFGRFPVIQSVFEPVPGYYVSPLSVAKNTAFPPWDQRYYLPPDKLAQQSFGALSSGLRAAAGLKLNDVILATRLDTDDTSTFPFSIRVRVQGG